MSARKKVPFFTKLDPELREALRRYKAAWNYGMKLPQANGKGAVLGVVEQAVGMNGDAIKFAQKTQASSFLCG